MNPTGKIMTKFLFAQILCAFLLITGCSEESNEEPITSISDYGTIQDSTTIQPVFEDSVTYHFLIEVGLITENNVLERKMSNRTADGVNFGQKDSISENFSSYIDPDFFMVEGEDASYIKTQIDFAEEKIWNMNTLGQDSIWNAYNNWCLENPDFDWDKFKDAGFGCFVDLGVPLFNKAHDIAIIYVGYQCHYLMGAGSIRKYEKVDGKWIFKEETNLWIS